MRVSGLEVREIQDSREISVVVDGFRLWYRIPLSLPFVKSGDPFAAVALLPAMARGESLDIDRDIPVSPKLVQGLSLLQEIHHSWNPALKVVPVRATTAPATSLHAGAMSFFSGGVDSTFTFLKRKDEISHLVFIQGFDFYTHDGNVAAFSVEDISNLAQLSHLLMKPRGAVADFIKAGLSERTLQALSRFAANGLGPEALEEALAGDFERIINRTSIYDESRFSGVKLRPETRECLAKPAAGESPARLNRLLLEDAFPLEIARRDSSAYRTAVARNTALASNSGKTLIPVATNHYPFGYRYNLSRNLTQGSALAGIALLLGFARAFVPAAYSYSQLIFLGSHPLTDPLWSTEGVRIVHEGAEARRVDKIVRIAGEATALANLRVCFDDMNVNCGHCPKCLRTLIPLRLLGASAAPFPLGPTALALRKTPITTEIEKIFFLENIELAKRTDKADLHAALRTALHRYERRKLLGDLDKAFFRGRLKRGFRRRAGAPPAMRRIDTIPPQD
ncbi:MAG: hypothetical protein A2V45_15635 [Candidatus Aminicenantes bacterium RBG_19FT_COMBO_58_17]|nr:MAG: hypothetical protein A2V45_15635 [Candidatus Aminicenantes bacterium RBG_19FT_COMBO_58_17]